MRCPTALLALAATVAAFPHPRAPASLTGTSPSPSTGSSHRSGGEEYVVLFDVDAALPPSVEEVLRRLDLSSDHSDVRYVYNNSAFRGFAASMKSHCIDALNAMSDVSHVEKSSLVSSFITREDTVWGLQRISSGAPLTGGDPRAMTYTYAYEDPALGSGVDIYVVDTGVNVNHTVFGGRAVTGFSFMGDTSDGDGHGTHVAATAAGEVFGVASRANIIAVKVLGADGSGLSADTIAGIDWVLQQHDANRARPGFTASIMNVSWGLSTLLPTIDRAIVKALSAGVHVTLAAGNSARDACLTSPSKNGGTGGDAIAVGSTGISDAISAFSNTGPCVDVFAPGEDIISAWKGGPNAINTISGTSMSCPHVTGLIAYLATSRPDLASSPAAMKRYVIDTSLQGAVAGTNGQGKPPVLVNNGQNAQDLVQGIVGRVERRESKGLDRFAAVWLGGHEKQGPRLRF